MNYVVLSIGILLSCSLSAQNPSSLIDDAKELVSTIAHDIEMGTQEIVHGLESTAEETYDLGTTYLETLQARYVAEKPDAYSATQASIMVSPLKQETHYLAARKDSAFKAVQKLLNNQSLTHETMPRIGLCGSGGGMRAMLETMGWLEGADQIDLLDTIWYVSGLSGSTWAFNPWISSQRSPAEYTKLLIPHLSKSLTDHVRTLIHERFTELMATLAQTYYNKRTLTVIDIYGALLSEVLFQPALIPMSQRMSLLGDSIHSGAYPFAISTAAVGSNDTVLKTFGHLPTVEFTPLFTGSFELGCFVPTWSFGRVFSHGSSREIEPQSLFPETSLVLDSIPEIERAAIIRLWDLIKSYENDPYYGQEVPLGYLMGICGSAFSTDFFNALFELYQLIKPGALDQDTEKPLKLCLDILQHLLEGLIGDLGDKLSQGELSEDEIHAYLQNHELGAAHVPNMRFELTQQPFDTLPDISLVDAGFNLDILNRANLGILPLLYRDLDVIYIIDSSADLEGAPSLRAAEDLAQRLGLPFPKISYEDIATKPLSVFYDEDGKAPTIVYMPGIMNERYNNQLNRSVDPGIYPAQQFQYTQQEAEDLIGLISFTVLEQKDVLIDTLRQAVAKKAPAP